MRPNRVRGVQAKGDATKVICFSWKHAKRKRKRKREKENKQSESKQLVEPLEVNHAKAQSKVIFQIKNIF